MQDAVDDEQPELRAGIVGVVADGHSRRDHHVAEHAEAAFVLAVQREAEHVGRPRLVEVPDVQLLHLGVVDETERQLHPPKPLGDQGLAGEGRQRVDVDRRGLAVADQDRGHGGRGMAAGTRIVAHRGSVIGRQPLLAVAAVRLDDVLNDLVANDVLAPQVDERDALDPFQDLLDDMQTRELTGR